MTDRCNDNGKAEQKDRILSYAIENFSRNGIRNVKMDDIASDLGISKRTLYQLFKDKENRRVLQIQRKTFCKTIF